MKRKCPCSIKHIGGNSPTLMALAMLYHLSSTLSVLKRFAIFVEIFADVCNPQRDRFCWQIPQTTMLSCTIEHVAYRSLLGYYYQFNCLPSSFNCLKFSSIDVAWLFCINFGTVGLRLSWSWHSCINLLTKCYEGTSLHIDVDLSVLTVTLWKKSRVFNHISYLYGEISVWAWVSNLPIMFLDKNGGLAKLGHGWVFTSHWFI